MYISIFDARTLIPQSEFGNRLEFGNHYKKVHTHIYISVCIHIHIHESIEQIVANILWALVCFYVCVYMDFQNLFVDE